MVGEGEAGVNCIYHLKHMIITGHNYINPQIPASKQIKLSKKALFYQEWKRITSWTMDKVQVRSTVLIYFKFYVIRIMMMRRRIICYYYSCTARMK